MFLKPSAKPLVFGSVNPSAKGGKSLKQNKTKQEGVGLVWFLKPNQTKPTHLLVSQPNKQGYFSCFFSLHALPKRSNLRFQTSVFNRFSTELSTSHVWG